MTNIIETIEVEQWPTEDPITLTEEYEQLRGTFDMPSEALELLNDMANILYTEGPDTFAAEVSGHQEILMQGCKLFPGFTEALVTMLRYGVAKGSKGCAINLGIMYFAGEVIPLDLAKACSLRMLAE